MKDKKAQTAMWVTIMIVSIIGIVSLQIMYTSIKDQTTTTAITDDQFTGSNTSCVQITEECILSLSSVENATGSVTIGAGNYSLCYSDSSGDYADGIELDDAEYNGMTLNATYTEVNCGYITGLTALVVNNLPIIFGVAILVFVAGFVMTKK